MILKISPLLMYGILEGFVKTLTADNMYPVRDYGNLSLTLKCNYLKKRRHFPYFLFHFWNLHQVLSILKRKMIVRANIFSKLQALKVLFTPLSKKLCFRTSFGIQHVKGSQTLVKSVWEIFFIFLVTLKGTNYENISLFDVWKLRCVC